jgi:hypothetical protein
VRSVIENAATDIKTPLAHAFVSAGHEPEVEVRYGLVGMGQHVSGDVIGAFGKSLFLDHHHRLLGFPSAERAPDFAVERHGLHPRAARELLGRVAPQNLLGRGDAGVAATFSILKTMPLPFPTHPIRRAAEAAALFLGMLLVGARPALACECVGVPTFEYLRSAELVYTGRVVSIRADTQRFPWPEIEFRVERTIKGRIDGERFVLVTPPSKGVNCRGFDFAAGKDYLVFATLRDSESGRPGTYGMNWCAGTVSLESDEGKQRLRETIQLTR